MAQWLPRGIPVSTSQDWQPWAQAGGTRRVYAEMQGRAGEHATDDADKAMGWMRLKGSLLCWR